MTACKQEGIQSFLDLYVRGTCVIAVILSSVKVPATQAFAYIEFLEPDAVANALLLADSTLQGRQIKVGRLLLHVAACH